MSEYVEKQALDDAFASLIPWAIANEIDAAYEQGLCAAHNALWGFPAADVVPVRRARWFTRTYYRESTHAYDCVMRVCSACETEWSYDAETGVSDFYYCPHCGAKMENAGNIGAP